ncbi:MAG: hypothetical protein ABI288_02615 [Ginsengibacter sp.]
MRKSYKILPQSVYKEIAEFMTTMNPAKVIAFKHSEANQTGFNFLMDKQTESVLAHDEKRELEHYLILNRIIGLARAQALILSGK